MDKLGLKLIELLRGGADPRRADRTRRRRDDEVSAAIHVRALTETGTRNLRAGLILGVLLGMIVTLVLLGIVGAVANLRPAHVSDIEMARRLRAVLPYPERLGENDFAQRLAVPPDVGRLVAPLVDLDRPAVPGQAAMVAVLAGQVGLFVDPGRLEALSQLARRLGPLTRQQRTDHLDSILELDRALHEPNAALILRAIADLPAGDLAALSRLTDLPRDLAEIAGLPPAKLQTLRQTALASVLPDDGERADLLRLLPTLDPPAVHLLVRWSNANSVQRQLLIFLLARIEDLDPSFVKLVTAFYVGNPLIGQAVRALHPSCGYAKPEACR